MTDLYRWIKEEPVHAGDESYVLVPTAGAGHEVFAEVYRRFNRFYVRLSSEIKPSSHHSTLSIAQDVATLEVETRFPARKRAYDWSWVLPVPENCLALV